MYSEEDAFAVYRTSNIQSRRSSTEDQAAPLHGFDDF
jgi:hypothetical protein